MPPPLATLVHILDTQWYWREGAQFGKLPREKLGPSDFSTLRSLRRRWDEEDHLLLAFVLSTRPLWHIIVDVVNHGTQHRSELALFLTAKGPKEEQGVRFWRRWALAQRAVQAPVVVSLSLPLDQHPGFVQRIEDPVSVARPAVYR
jgi:uncharacterized damage-inducible protein DinB